METAYFLSNFLRLIQTSENDRFRRMKNRHTQGAKILWALFLFSVVRLDLFAMAAAPLPLKDLVAESEVVIIGHVNKVESIKSKWGNHLSAIDVLEVLKGPKDIVKINFLDTDEGRSTGFICPPREIGVLPKSFYILFLKKTADTDQYYSPQQNDGKYLLPQDEIKRMENIALLKRHLTFLQGNAKSVKELKEIVLAELETESISEFGLWTLIRDADAGDHKLLNSFNEREQVSLFKFYELKPISYASWMTFADMLFHMKKRSDSLLQLLTVKLRSEKDSPDILTTYGFFWTMCLVDASVEEDLGTSVPDNTPEVFLHVEKWKSFPTKKKQEIINGFFERVPFKEEGSTQSKPRR
jgi:hypothetical protein